MPRFFYSLLLYLVIPFTPLKLWWRGLRQPEYRDHWGERFGYYHQQAHAPLIWLHCVSVGETRAAAPLIDALLAAYPKHQLLVTHATPTGRATSEQLYGNRVLRCYLPYDTPGAVKRFLKHFQPQLGLLMETELWFNLIALCKQREMPLLLVNARLSAKSAKGYGRFPNLMRQGLQNLQHIAAQTAEDAERFMQLGANNVSVCGNLKFDVMPPADAAMLGASLRDLLGTTRPVFLAASTREGEEALILDAISQARVPRLLSIIVPRHPQRFDEVATMMTKRGVRFLRRSKLAEPVPDNVSTLLGDSMGEMFTYYGACDVAFIGGSLAPLGGQNLIEASAMSKPVLIGPHTFNFALATELAIQAGAAWRVNEVADLADALKRLMADHDKRTSMSLAALEFSTSAGGATQAIMANIAERMPTP